MNNKKTYLQRVATMAGDLGRTMLGLQAQSDNGGFRGSGSGRRLGSWQETDAAINSLLSAEGDELRRRCRGMVRKNHWARCAQDSYVANCIGTGIKPQSLHPDPEIRKLLHSEFARWTDEADSEGLTDFYGLQALMMREMFEAGEVITRLRSRLPEDSLRVPMQLQLIESEHLPFTLNQLNGKNVIRSGIEFTPFGRREAYWLYREHPGLGALTMSVTANEPVRITARDQAGLPMVLHNFVPLRAGQYRGQPWLAPVMITLYELDQFVDAVLVRQKLANMFVGWQRRSDLNDPGPMLATPTLPDGQESAEEGVGFGKLEPGTILDMDPGDTLEFSDPPGPGSEFGEFLKIMLHAFASGVGVPYEQITWDLEKVNYSSIRTGMLEFRRRCEQLQFAVVVYQFCRPIWNRWINDAVMAGVIPKPSTPRGWDELRAVKWRTPKWAWVDPLKDTTAAVQAIRAGLQSRDGYIHELGEDPEVIDQEVSDGNARADALGNVYDSDPRKTTGSGQAADHLIKKELEKEE